MFDSIVAWATGLDTEAIKKGQDADARMKEIAQDKYDRGVINAQVYSTTVADIDASHQTVHGDVASVESEFANGIKDQPTKIAGWFNGVIGSTIKLVWKALPWPIWVVIGIALIVWLAPMITSVAKVAPKKV